MNQAVLRTERFRLVPLGDEHLEHEAELDADPQVMRFLGRVRTRDEVEQQHAERLGMAQAARGLGAWAGEVAGDFAGWWSLQPPTRPDQGPVEGRAELGYRVLRRYWRRGLVSEGARELLRHGFDDLGLQRIFAETMAVNEASRATMAAIGLQQGRTFALEFEEPLPGTEFGEVEYALARDQWIRRG